MKITISKPQAIHEVGRRSNQEDALYPNPHDATIQDRIFVLCDGMGGHEKGEVASQTVSKTIGEWLDKHAPADVVVSDDMLLRALEAAYQALDKKDDGAAKKMGTTLCLLLLHRGGTTLMHIGDSRIYHVRPSEHRVVYQSKDHSMVYELYQAGEITFDEMKTSPVKNIITRAMQPGEDNRVKPAIVHVADVKPGDYFYMCSDGMLEQMSNNELCDILSTNGSDEKKRQQLVAATIDNSDNHTAWLVRVETVTAESGDNALENDEMTSNDNAILLFQRKRGGDVEVVGGSNAEGTLPKSGAPKGARRPGLKPRRDWRTIAIASLCALAVIVLVFAVAIPSSKNDRKETSQPAGQSPYPSQSYRQGPIKGPQRSAQDKAATKGKTDKATGESTLDKAEKEAEEGAKAIGGDIKKAETEYEMEASKAAKEDEAKAKEEVKEEGKELGDIEKAIKKGLNSKKGNGGSTPPTRPNANDGNGGTHI